MADNPVKAMLARASSLDARRQRQIENQKASISRLLADPDAEAEIARLNAELAVAQENYAKALEFMNYNGQMDQDFHDWKEATA